MEKVVSIGVGSQIDGVVPIDEAGNARTTAIIWMDRRAKHECDVIRSLKSEESVYAMTGLTIDPSHMAPKIMWIRRNQPDTYRKVKHFLLPGSYVLYSLTGQIYTDHSNASCSLLYDITRRQWSNELCDLFEIPPEMLPEIRESTVVAGNIRPSVGRMCNLSSDVTVVVGGGDEEVGAVGACVIDDKAFLDLTGTSEPMCMSLDKPFFDPGRILECHAHASPGKWMLENTGGMAGGIYNWFKDQFASAESQQAEREGVEVYDILNNEISSTSAGSDGLVFLPFFSGSILPEWNPDARGVLLGLTLRHSRQQVARSIMEGCAFVLKDAVERLSEIGHNPSRIVLAGGGARGRIWRQIKTDVVNRKTFRAINEEVTAMGAAVLAAVGAGSYKTVEDAASRMVAVSDELLPNEESAMKYVQLYDIYRTAYSSLRQTFRLLASFQERVSDGTE